MPKAPAAAKKHAGGSASDAPKAKRQRVAYEGPKGSNGVPLDLLDMPITAFSTHGERGKAQEALATTGDTFESEHAIGYEVLAQGTGRPGTGIQGRIEMRAPAYQESKYHHRGHIGTGNHGKITKRKNTGKRDIRGSDVIRRKVTARQRAEAILGRIAARSGKHPVESEKHETVKKLVDAYLGGASPRDVRALTRPTLKWMRESSAAPARPPSDDVYGFASSAAYREGQENSLMNRPAALRKGAPSAPSDVMRWGKDANGDEIMGDPDYEPDRYDPTEARVGDALQQNLLGYAFQPGFQRLSELPATGKRKAQAAKLLTSPKELERQQHAADHAYLSMVLNMSEDIEMVDPAKAPEIAPARKAKRARADD